MELKVVFRRQVHNLQIIRGDGVKSTANFEVYLKTLNRLSKFSQHRIRIAFDIRNGNISWNRTTQLLNLVILN